MFNEDNFMGKKPVPYEFKKGDHVRVIQVMCCNQNLGKTGLIFDLDTEDGILLYWVNFDVEGKNHAYSYEEIELI